LPLASVSLSGLDVKGLRLTEDLAATRRRRRDDDIIIAPFRAPLTSSNRAKPSLLQP
jgi:hypothetical protein